YPNCWRKEGHALSLEDLQPVVTQRPGVLVVGTGTAGNMRPDPELEDALEALGIGIEAMQTAEAVRRFNELIGLGDVEVAAALHLTC
ncbi:MAG: MTH938/NDUFAF3 family protein, partial [Acidimicrobiia bacterium]